MARKRVLSRVEGPKAKVERVLSYKVVELSTVDEVAIESTLNEWVRQGWRFESLQFAMRESSKRPAMAFVFFTREVEASEVDAARPQSVAAHKLRQLATRPRGEGEARARLLELASEDDA